ncbi:MAG: bifunctional precorrin-2 dehydrogenase/sirohydrochlorin ferrochelatase [Pirellulaceae bacterium]|nr:bifunctional precorrin-2 dehydrogenase/sirohydrochlorin ferrochelatase [Pirellulaceae bacterium]
MPAYYPSTLDVRGRSCQVYGGDGHEAERKVRYFLDCGGNVTFFAPEDETSEGLKELAEAGTVNWVKRKYQSGDLEGAWIVVVADTSSQETNEAAAEEARERNVLMNVMDVTPLCTFIAPAIIQREDVTVSVSTAGTSPALARRLREQISDHGFCQCLRWADVGPILADIRTDVRARELPLTPNDWQEVMTNDVLEMFESGDPDRAKKMLLTGLEAIAKTNAGN